jgi:hypothetical protein
MADPTSAPDRRPASAASSPPDSSRPVILSVHILPQPDDETCGPTCLHAVYRYWGEEVRLDEVIASTRSLGAASGGRGTLAVMLGIHALSRGYRATLYTFDLHVFDPTWFGGNCLATSALLTSKLRQQAEARNADDPMFAIATDSYLEFLARCGRIRFRDPTGRLISRFMRDGLPVLTGVSATYLYRCAREFGPNDDYDDIRGGPAGHFVVLHGYDPKSRHVSIADPLQDNPGFEGQRYTVSIYRLVPAIMLGVLTHDANLLVIEPAERRQHGRAMR